MVWLDDQRIPSLKQEGLASKSLYEHVSECISQKAANLGLEKQVVVVVVTVEPLEGRRNNPKTLRIPLHTRKRKTLCFFTSFFPRLNSGFSR